MLFSTVRVQNFRSILDSGTIQLGPATVVIGRNNSGKSSLLRAICNLQLGTSFADEDIRIGQSSASIITDVTPELASHLRTFVPNLPENTTLEYRSIFGSGATIDSRVYWNNNEAAASAGPFSFQRDQSVIVPVLARRKADGYDTGVSVTAGRQISVSDRGLTSRILSLSTGQFPEAQRYRQLTERILGVPVAVFLTSLGQQPGVPLGPDAAAR